MTEPTDLIARWAQNEVDAVTALSVESLDNLFVMFGPHGDRLRETPLFVPHERVASAAGRYGASQVVVAGPSDAEMAERLVAYFSA
jgi:uroporphyrinogen-III synthase